MTITNGTKPLLVERITAIEGRAIGSKGAGASSVADVFEEQAARTPGAIAIQAGAARVSYAELDALANGYAARLRAAGVGPESVVGVLLGRRIEAVASLLGVWKAGAAYLPLDPELPTERLGYMLSAAGAMLVQTESSLLTRVPADFTGPRIVVDDGTTVPRPGAPLARVGDRDHLAYVIFTSGSTGRPKGVQIAQRSLINLLFSMRLRFTAGPGHVWLAATSFSFDIAAAELWLPLITGGRIVLAADDQVHDGSALLGLIRGGGATHVQATPAGWRLLIDAGFRNWPGVAVVTGEACPPALAGDLRARVGRLHDLYGPTETTIWSTGWEVPGPVDVVPIGRPIHNTRVYVLDENLEPVAVGVIGELYLAGDGVARGYAGRPDLTAERFLPEPFGPRPGARMYRTGDIARFRPDGDLECLGRVDHQVKLRGYRIELGEVEERLRLHPDVEAAVVVAREHPGSDKSLVAYVVGTVDRVPEHAAMRAFLADALPEYMVPAAFVRLEAIPLNPAGKVDRAALPDPGRAAFVAEKTYVEPRSDLERLLVRVCQEALGLEQVGVQDRFVELGVDSLRIVSVLSAARRVGVEMSLKMLLMCETVEQLAAALGDVAVVASVTPFDSLLKALTPGQRERLESLPEWPNRAIVSVETGTDLDTLRRALNAVVVHHPSLRLRATDLDAGSARIAEPDQGYLADLLTEVDLRLFDPRTRDGVRRGLEQTWGGLDLQSGPMIEAVLLRTGDARDEVLLRAHPVAVDRRSWPVIVADLEAAYTALAAGRVVELPDCVSPWSLAAASESVAPDPIVPSSVPRLPERGDSRRSGYRFVDVSLNRPVTAVAARAALASVLATWIGADRVLIALEQDLRDAEGQGRPRAVGQLTHYVPTIVLAPSGDSTAVTGVEPQVLFRSAPATTGSDRFRLAGVPEAPAHQLEVTVVTGTGDLSVRWAYRAGRHDEDTVRRLAQAHLRALGGAVGAAGPARPAVGDQPDPLSPLAAMQEHRVPGVSLAVIRDGVLDRVAAFGLRAAGGAPVTPETRFHVASISKHVTATATLRLADEGRLDLDEDVNTYLRRWRVPGTADDRPITVRQLLANRSGLSSTPADWYPPSAPVPSLLALLRGEAPGQTGPIQRQDPPERTFRKTGSHWAVLQVVLEDLTGTPFADLIDDVVFVPLGMSGSTFEPFFAETERALGHDQTGAPITEGWRTRPTRAANGLWSTATDLALLAAEIRCAHQGGPARLLSSDAARQMLTVGHPGSFYGLGTVVDDSGPDLEFGHGGEAVGYRSMVMTRLQSGTGFVVLTNGEAGKHVQTMIADAVSRQSGGEPITGRDGR